MKRRRLIPFAVIMILLVTGILFGGARLTAAGLDTSEAGEADDIGKFNDSIGGYSHVGVKVYWDDKLECYALDTYKKNESNIWQYVLSNINGQKERSSSCYRNSESPFWLSDVNASSGGRFMFRSEKVKKGRTDYSVYIELYSKGKLTWTGYEIANVPSGQHGALDCGSRSFKRDDNPEVGGFTADGASLVYRVYSPRSIEPDGDELSLDAHGGTVEKNGKAYFRREGLYLFELPVVSMNKPGYTCTFKGWYSSAEGGEAYKVGDILQKGDVLHARWDITPNAYDVTCIDILGENPDGKVLGQTSWKANFGTTANASKAGTNKAVGAYYPHCFYKDSDTAQVTTDGAKVYRYFSYESCPVEYVDEIEEGSRAGEILKRTTQRKEYSTMASGSDIGMDPAPGTYYKGYYYTHGTSRQVAEQGTIVYRYFKPIQYTIVIDGNGSTEGSMDCIESCQYDQVVPLEKNGFRKDSLITLYSNEPQKQSETTTMTVRQNFLGWATQKSGPVRFTDGETIKNLTAQNETVTLYAVWSEENTTLPTLAAPMGYHFLGWAETADAQTGLMQRNISDSMELYAVWKRDIVKYHIEYYKENLAGEYDLAASYQFDGYTGDEVSVDSVDKASPGFTLDTSSSKLNGIIKADGSLILCAYYRRNSYQIQYDLNGGSLDSGDELTREKIKFGMNLVLPAIIPHRDGYLFQGWYQDADETNTLLKPRDNYVMQNHDVILHAKWKQISYKITYDKNEKYAGISEITGEVPDTDYIYQKDSYASSTLYQSADAVMVFWNTRPDGSGVSVLPGTNIKGLFDSENGLTLYAIWKWNDSDEYVSFQLKLWQEKKDGKEIVDTLKLYGKPGEQVSVALLRLYQRELAGESVIYFYRGYEVTNPEELERIISLKANTEISLTIRERKCTVSFQDAGDTSETSLSEITAGYHEEYILPESLLDGLKIDRYEDSQGNYYFPGDKIVLERNLQLYPQQAVHLHDEKGGEKDVILYVNRGSNYILPDLSFNGYRLIEWTDAMGEAVGKPGQSIKNIRKRCDFYARWSEPLTYQITYDLEGSGVKILENAVSYYQYTKGAALPDANQIVVPDGYRFDGWYQSSDVKQTLISKIASTEFGDIHLKPRLSKQDGTDSNDNGQNSSGSQSDSDNKNESTDKSQSSSDNENNITSESPDKTQNGNSNSSNTGDKTQDNNNNSSNSGDKNQNDSNNPSSSGDKNQNDSNNSSNLGDKNQNGSNNPSDSGGKNQNGSNNPSNSGNGTQNSNNTSFESDGKNQNGNLFGSDNGDKKRDTSAVGTTFWKGRIQYKILSIQQGKNRVKVIRIKKTAKKISIPSNVSYQKVSFQVTAISSKAFHKAKTVCIVIPKTISKLGKSSFSHMKHLKKVTIGAGIRSIGKKAFWNDRKLRQIIIKSKKLKKISKKAFVGIHRKAAFQIPKCKKRTYQRMLKKSVQRQTTVIHILR